MPNGTNKPMCLTIRYCPDPIRKPRLVGNAPPTPWWACGQSSFLEQTHGVALTIILNPRNSRRRPSFMAASFRSIGARHSPAQWRRKWGHHRRFWAVPARRGDRACGRRRHSRSANDPPWRAARRRSPQPAPNRIGAHRCPEFTQSSDTSFWSIANYDRSIDRTYRNAGNPIGTDASFVKRLINTRLIGAKRATALQR